MRTPSIALSLLAVAVAVTGCAPDATAPAPAAAGLRAARAAEGVPVTGQCEATFSAPTPVSPGVIRQTDTGTCTISHLGLTTLSSTKVIDLVAGTQQTAPVYTAANGDRLYASGGGTNAMVAPGRVRFAATLAVTGGTGRFAGATGELQVAGEADLAASTSAMTLTGWIAYGR